MRALALLCVCACADVTVVSYRPSKITTGPIIGAHGRSFVARPPVGEAAAAVLADGFPVWVVPHTDGTVTVISAAAPPPPRNGRTYDGVSAQIDQALVAWLPGARQFHANGIAFDERGHVLGYTASGICFDECPKIQNMPQLLHDLDTFAVSFDSTTVEVRELVEGHPRKRADTFIPWQPATRDHDLESLAVPTIPRLSLKAALALAEGRFAIVDGQTVRSSQARPVICEPAKGACGTCGPDRLELEGIVASDAAHVHSSGWWKDPADYHRSLKRPYTEAQPGTFLVQRQGAGFQIVAGNFRGICSGSW